MLEKIGFKHVRAVEEERRRPFDTDECFKDSILERMKLIHQLSPEATKTFKAEALQVYEKEVPYHYCAIFVRRCAEEFQWKDLSEDVVMDIGCGDELNCCKAILMQFPDVRALIAVDKESTVFQTVHFRHRRIQFVVGDIEERDPFKS
ncbi:jhamt, partial [Trichonephila clavata]